MQVNLQLGGPRALGGQLRTNEPVRGRLRAAALVLVALACAACGGGHATGARNHGQRRSQVLRVPASYRTIQAAVDAARPGDLVLIAPGVYHESVTVAGSHPDIVIRGLDRNRVVLDGQNRLGNGISVNADGVAVENLTVRNYLVNGVEWSPAGQGSSRPLEGWRGSYITAYNNGLYGVYAYVAERGRFDHVYASGSPDSGIYVGACNPCHALVRNSVAEHNQVGYEATNASGDVSVLDNLWRNNRVGAEIDSLRKEPSFPQDGGSTLARNRILDNNDRRAPRSTEGGFGAGVAINGGSGNVLEDNLVTGHSEVGIIVLDSTDSVATNNTVRSNRLHSNAVALALQTSGGLSQGNCFQDNRPTGRVESVPAGLQAATGRSCGTRVKVGAGRLRLLTPPPQVDYATLPAPPPQPNMPAAATAPARPAVGDPERETQG